MTSPNPSSNASSNAPADPAASLEGGLERTPSGVRQVVRSPEQVELHLPLAGPTGRMLAYAIDWIVIVLLELALAAALVTFFVSSDALVEWVQEIVGPLADQVDPNDPDSILGSGFILLLILLFLLVAIAAEGIYFIVSERITGGRSLGKWAIGLRVVEDGGRPLTLRSSVVRNVLRLVDMLPTTYLFGLIAMLASEEGKRLGDMAAGTVVVRLDTPPPAPPIQLDAPGADAFRFDREQLARVGETERALVRQTLRRAPTLPPPLAAEALGRAAAVLAERMGHEPVPPREQRAFLQALLEATQRR